MNIRRFALQVVLLVVAMIALTTGALGLSRGMSDGLYLAAGSGTAILDSNLRYFSGLWVGVGFVLLWIVPAVERETAMLAAVSAMIFLGGLGRVLSMVRAGLPPPLFVLFTALELAFPTLLLWQRHLRLHDPGVRAPEPAAEPAVRQ